MTERERDEGSGTILPPGAEQWIAGYQEHVLAGKREETIEAYIRILRQVTHWIAGLPDSQGRFSPGLLTPEAVTSYIREQADVNSPSHLKRVRSVLNGFCLWLIAQGELEIAPVVGISLPASAPVSPGALTQQQRETLSTLVERRAGLRGKAIFSLGYAAGCRVSEISHLLLEHTEANAREGRLRLGIPGRAERTIILADEVREALYAYLISGKRAQSAYLFTSQRERATVPHGDRDGWRLRESAIHAWFQELRGAATPEEWELIGGLTFHDLRRDFAFRAREAGFSETELAAYLGLGHRPIAGDVPGMRREVDPQQLREKLHRLKSR
jgi:site-specific recombinase XerD